ncbi:MAG: hypothetical protein FWD45_02865, partial [Coriobacteriia bacterium]|nr:hypothetical protein [Coriobacteriia bacterium]
MICPFCDSSYTVESLASLDDAINASAAQAAEAAAQVAAGAAGAVGAAAAAGSYPPPTPRTDWIMPSQTWEAGEQDDMHVFTCKTCAGAIVADSTMSSTSCPYCGNPIVITERFSGTLKPDVVIPFKLTKEDAKRALQNHYKDKPFLPNFFTDDNRLNEVKGVYV